jgi:hypothetical protein
MRKPAAQGYPGVAELTFGLLDRVLGSRRQLLC